MRKMSKRLEITEKTGVYSIFKQESVFHNINEVVFKPKQLFNGYFIEKFKFFRITPNTVFKLIENQLSNVKKLKFYFAEFKSFKLDHCVYQKLVNVTSMTIYEFSPERIHRKFFSLFENLTELSIIKSIVSIELVLGERLRRLKLRESQVLEKITLKNATQLKTLKIETSEINNEDFFNNYDGKFEEMQEFTFKSKRNIYFPISFLRNMKRLKKFILFVENLNTENLCEIASVEDVELNINAFEDAKISRLVSCFPNARKITIYWNVGSTKHQNLLNVLLTFKNLTELHVICNVITFFGKKILLDIANSVHTCKKLLISTIVLTEKDFDEIIENFKETLASCSTEKELSLEIEYFEFIGDISYLEYDDAKISVKKIKRNRDYFSTRRVNIDLCTEDFEESDDDARDVLKRAKCEI
ncbi:hypothetical protein B4U79_17088 [Dinothrombium tinctorium]|uniref:Uncharacterized protein n=1 Tax=Dinothrombium tinctorium TaxID=1965070 RepID=A0A3S3P202_9ACAR|nr:hypothetical protein B4U79_17088 [Dinothrombium tinctorium]